MNRCHLLLPLALLCVSSLAVPAQQLPDAAPVAAPAPPATPATNTDRAWGLLSSTVADTKHVEAATQALAALGTMGLNPHAAGLIKTALLDPEMDIRTAAILSAGQTRNPALRGPLRTALNDPEPGVAFTAAVTLWKMHDHTGEDLLIAVADGDRRAGATLYNGAMHTASRDLHSPATLARMGAMHGAYMLLGPFGIGLSAIEYARRNGGESARGNAIDLLAEIHTADIHKELVEALDDKDPAVRAAAAKGLGQWHDKATAGVLVPLFDDSKLPVRLTAAAAYIRASGPRHASPAPKQ